MIVIKILLGLAPVLIYLGALVLMDSYKLVRPRAVLGAIIAGMAAVIICRWVNTALWQATGLSSIALARYVAPLTEETAKSAYLVNQIARQRTGFLVDASIIGFAVGAGFGMLENLFFIDLIPSAGLFVWVLRGCGTAMMHGSTTAVFGIVAHRRGEAAGRTSARVILPALALAVALHSAYNHFFVSPVVTAAGLIVGIPLVMVVVFQRSEQALERWLGVGFDSDAELLATIGAGRLGMTRVGTYLMSLRERFAPTVVADMLCLLRLQVELSIQTKGLLLMRKEGFDVPAPDVQEKVAELRFLERSIGPTGRLALRPFLHAGRKDSWQKHLLR